jgi:hypothetical protein
MYVCLFLSHSGACAICSNRQVVMHSHYLGPLTEISHRKVLYKMLISLYLMTRSLKFLGIGSCVLAAAFLVMGISAIAPDAIAQNTTEKGTGQGLGVPENATGAQSSPEAMNNTLAPMGPENETVIAN